MKTNFNRHIKRMEPKRLTNKIVVSQKYKFYEMTKNEIELCNKITQTDI